MWQRIQSVFLGVLIVSLILSFIYPVWTTTETSTTIYRLYPIYFMAREAGTNGPTTTGVYFPFAITALLAAASITIAIMEFRRFDNRMLQVKLGTLNSLFLAGIMICDVLFSNQLAKAHPRPWTYGLSLYLTFVAVACNWLAIRFIRRDEKLVRDSERIR